MSVAASTARSPPAVILVAAPIEVWVVTEPSALARLPRTPTKPPTDPSEEAEEIPSPTAGGVLPGHRRNGHAPAGLHDRLCADVRRNCRVNRHVREGAADSYPARGHAGGRGVHLGARLGLDADVAGRIHEHVVSQVRADAARDGRRRVVVAVTDEAARGGSGGGGRRVGGRGLDEERADLEGRARSHVRGGLASGLRRRHGPAPRGEADRQGLRVGVQGARSGRGQGDAAHGLARLLPDLDVGADVGRSGPLYRAVHDARAGRDAADGCAHAHAVHCRVGVR